MKLPWISVKENNHLHFILQRKVASIKIPVIDQGRKNFPVLRCGSCLHRKSWQKRFSSTASYLVTTSPWWLVTTENLFLPSFARFVQSTQPSTAARTSSVLKTTSKGLLSDTGSFLPERKRCYARRQSTSSVSQKKCS